MNPYQSIDYTFRSTPRNSLEPGNGSSKHESVDPYMPYELVDMLQIDLELETFIRNYFMPKESNPFFENLVDDFWALSMEDTT